VSYHCNFYEHLHLCSEVMSPNFLLLQTGGKPWPTSGRVLINLLMFSAIVFLLLTQMSNRKFGQYLVYCVHVNTKDSIYICYVFSDSKWACVERL